MVPLLYLCLFLPQSLVVEGYSCSSQSEIAILMDESGSVGRSDFQIMKNFVADFMSAFAIGPNRFTVTTFNSWPTLQIELSENADLGQLQKKVGDLYYNGGGTDIESALRNARLHSFRNARPGVPQILVLITDGQSSGQIVQEANLLKGRGVIIFCVGVGYGINENLLRSISSDSSYTLIVHSFDLLMDIKDRLSHNTCSSEINECISNPCRHGGHCQDYVGYYQCQCLNGYDGTNCEYEDLCITTSPCKNNGVCHPRGHRNYYCTCPDSWQGLNCETDVDECSRTPSLCGHGSCVNTPGSYYCNCETGWQGSNCDTDIDECSTGTPCSHGGTCNNTQGSFTCFCPSQWTGATCQTDVNECANTVYPACFNGGTCHNHPGYFTCTCAQGWTGTTCNNDINECTSSPCINCGYCLNLAGTHKCSCKVGFAGDRCQNDIDECLSSQTVCQNNGQCVNHIGGSSCQCKDAYFGPLCEKEYDLCNQSICLNNGTCSVVGGIASCTCNENYTGSFCQSETDACSSSPCLNNGTCVVSENSYACNCLGGFNGTNCEQDIDECLEEPCPTSTSCVNLHGGFTCGNCSDEVNKSSSDCSSVHECSPAICYNNGNCSIVEGRISCTCKENYTGNFCETEIDICTSSPCLNNGTCVASDDSFICNCTKGFNGTICEQDIDECLEDPCPTNTACVNLHGGFTCSNCSDDPNNSSSGCLNSTSFCLTDDPCQHDGQCLGSANNYTCICIGGWNGTHCEEDVDECLQLPCQNNGYCLNTFGSFECLCQTGYTGFHCEQDIDECSSSPCMYGGTCTVRVGSYSCCCTPGRKGDNCSEDVDECQLMPCKNNGTCINLDGDYKCNCKADFTSKNCEEDIDECTSSPCKNGGVCENHYGGMKCRCHGGWGGTYCDGDVDECREEAPCQNGGLCTNTQGSYFCTCPTDVDSNWTGKNCTQDVNECEPSNPCQNGGTCHNTPGSYNCSCHPGFTGRNCETDINECLAFPCLNNAICNNTIGSYWCECVDNWDGAICSIDLCKTKAADLIFLVDTSMSTSNTWFEKQLDFIKNTINKLTLDDDKFNVSVISYSTDAFVDVDFNSYENKTDFMEKLGNITYQNGTTNLTKAFEEAKRVLTSRKGAAQFVFLLTDGMPLNLSEAVNGITLLRNHLMTSSFDNNLFILSQGDDVRPEGIAALSDDRFYYRDTFTTHNNEALFESFRILVDEKCTACTKTYSDETDMVFLIDIGTRQPYTTFILQTAVLDRFTHRLKILNLHENHTQVSALTFSSDVKEILWLNSTYDPDTVKSFLSGVTIDESNSTSDVARALRFVRTEVFSENHGARLSSRKIVFLPITGYDSDVKATFSEAQKLKSDGTLIFTLGIGSEFSEDDVLNLSTDALFAVFAEEGTTDENVRMLLKHAKYHSCTSRINS